MGINELIGLANNLSGNLGIFFAFVLFLFGVASILKFSTSVVVKEETYHKIKHDDSPKYHKPVIKKINYAYGDENKGDGYR